MANEQFKTHRKELERIPNLLVARSCIILAGGPRTGKTSTAIRISERYNTTMKCIHADSFAPDPDTLIDKAKSWSLQSEKISKLFAKTGPWICEGTRTVHAIRKYLKTHDRLQATVVWMNNPIQKQTIKQEQMAKGCLTVWNTIDHTRIMKVIDVT